MDGNANEVKTKICLTRNSRFPMEYDFFRLNGSYEPLGINSYHWGTTVWENGRPIIRLGDDASYGTLLEELYHTRQIEKLRLQYFQKLGKMPSDDELNLMMKNRNVKPEWEDEATTYINELGFDRIIIGND